MSNAPSVSFAKPTAPKSGILVVLVGSDLKSSADSVVPGAEKLIKRAADAMNFKGKPKSSLNIAAPDGLSCDRLIGIGVGEWDEMSAQDWTNLGGAIAGACSGDLAVAILAQLPDGEEPAPADVAALAAGFKLRSYNFDRYKSADPDQPKKTARKLTIMTGAAAAVRRNWTSADAAASGTILARDLVHEPPNVLTTEEFAKRAKELEKLGVKVTILTEKDLKKLKMGALLGVAQGSEMPPRLVIMEWNGGKAKSKPVALVGKGVVFDSGGLSIKPAGGMEAMKGDMGGAAAVVGAMHAIAARKAKSNVVGVIGLVENMPDGKAQRPGDIVTSMSGKTIEVLNTDAEGRLVLADALHYTEKKFDPVIMIDLATLTGACMVALGQHHAGLFCNDDGLAVQLVEAGQRTGEMLWRMPLSKDYDKMIDTPVADMKNIGGRYAGAITAAQFLQRFVDKTKWAHLDIAGTAFSSQKSDVSTGWASGYGARLLNQLVADHYE
jgi:leucyl aminopeptidase